MTPDQIATLRCIAESVADDVAEYRTPGGIPTWDDERVGRMLARDPLVAELVPLAIGELARVTAELAPLAIGELARVTAERDANDARALELVRQLTAVERERDRLLAENVNLKRSPRRLADGVVPAVGQRVVLIQEACKRSGLAHAHDELVHEITSLLGGDTHLIECGARQISVSHLRLAPAGTEVTCRNCNGWAEQRQRMRIDAEAYRETRRFEQERDAACAELERVTAARDQLVIEVGTLRANCAAAERQVGELLARLADTKAKAESLAKQLLDATLYAPSSDPNNLWARPSEPAADLAALRAELRDVMLARDHALLQVERLQARLGSDRDYKALYLDMIGRLEAWAVLLDAKGNPVIAAELRSRMTVPADLPRHETSASIAAWQHDTFGAATTTMQRIDRSYDAITGAMRRAADVIRQDRHDLIARPSLSQAIRAAEELAELIDVLVERDDDPRAVEEVADVQIVLAGIPAAHGREAQDAIDAKMAVNRARKWRTTGDGHGQHTLSQHVDEPGAEP